MLPLRSNLFNALLFKPSYDISICFKFFPIIWKGGRFSFKIFQVDFFSTLSYKVDCIFDVLFLLALTAHQVFFASPIVWVLSWIPVLLSFLQFQFLKMCIALSKIKLQHWIAILSCASILSVRNPKRMRSLTIKWVEIFNLEFDIPSVD